MGLILNRRREMGGSGEVLPSGAVKIQYIQSSGTQYIDTGYKVSSEVVEYKIKQASVELGGSYHAQRSYGSYDGKRSGILYLNFSTIFIGAGSNDVNMGLSHTVNTVREYDVKLNNGTINLTVDGASATNTYSGSLKSSLNNYLFACYEGGGASSFGKLKLYYFQIYDNGTLARDFIPVRVGQVGYLYDRVSKTLFGNAGSGSFTLGPDV